VNVIPSSGGVVIAMVQRIVQSALSNTFYAAVAMSD
jgi:hypothetical protein